MKEIFKTLLIIILCIFLTAVVLWSAETIPLWRQVIQTMEITTGYHLTFKDYLQSSFMILMINIIIKLMKWFLGDKDDNS